MPFPDLRARSRRCDSTGLPHEQRGHAGAGDVHDEGFGGVEDLEGFGVDFAVGGQEPGVERMEVREAEFRVVVGAFVLELPLSDFVGGEEEGGGAGRWGEVVGVDLRADFGGEGEEEVEDTGWSDELVGWGYDGLVVFCVVMAVACPLLLAPSALKALS